MHTKSNLKSRLAAAVIGGASLSLRTALLAGAGLLLFAPSDVAFAQKISGELRGTVTGPDGTGIGGADVSIVNTGTGAMLSTTSRTDGTFNFTGLSVGNAYTVKVHADGYKDVSAEHVTITTSTASLDIPLAAPSTETVVVSGVRTPAPTEIVENHGVATNIDEKVVAQTPSFQSNLKDLMQRSPFAFVDPVGGGNLPPIATLNVVGTNPRCVPLLVDGLEQSDNFGLNFSGYPTPTSPVAYPWIKQAELVVTPYDVEYQSCGPVQNIVTKSGENEFHGGFYGEFSDQSLNGDKFGGTTVLGVSKKFLTTSEFAALTPAQLADPTKSFAKYGTKPPYRDENYGLYLSGPIWEDHIFFFIGYDENRNTTNPGLQTAVGPAGSNFAKTTPFISQSEVDQVVNIAKTVYHFDPGSLADTVFTEYDQKFIGKLDYQINDNQRVDFSYQHTAGETPTVNSGSTSTVAPQMTLPSNWYVNRQKLESMTLQWFANWTDNFTTQINVGHTGVRDDQVPFNGTNFPAVYVRTPGCNGVLEVGAAGTSITKNATTCAAVQPAATSDDGYIVLGPDFSRQFNFLNYKDDFGKGIAEYVIDDHTLKGGVEFHRFGYNDDFLQGAQSVVRFDSIADFQNQKIAQTIDTRSNATATSLQAGNPIYFANGAITHNPNDADGVFKYITGAAFIQDTWDPLEGLDITGGIRWDKYWDGDKPVLNTAFTQRYGFTNQKTYNNLSTLDPRVSASYHWSLDDDDLPNYAPSTDITLRSGVGEMSGGILAVWLTDSYDTTGVQAVNVFGIPAFPVPGGPCTTAAPMQCVPDFLPVDHQAWLNTLNNGPLTTATLAKTGTVNAILPNFRLPSTLFYNVGADFHFSNGWLGDDWLFTIDFLGADGYHQPYWTNLRIQPQATRAPDGRLMYQWTFDQLQGRPDPAGVAGQLTGTDIGLGSVDGGHRNVWAFSLTKQWLDTGYGDVSLYMAYAHEHVTDTTSAVSSVANSVFVNRASVNFNEPEVGISDYQRTHRFTMDLDVTEHFIDDLATNFDAYVQRLSGEPYSLTYGGDPFGPFSPAGVNNGGVTGRSLVYVPQVDPTTQLVTATSDPIVTYAPGFDFAGFNKMLQATHLIKYAGLISPRNAFQGPWNTLINLKIDQEIPLPDIDYVPSQKLFAEIYIFNLGNLINHNWGPQISPNFYQAFTAINTNIVAGNKYQYTGFTSANGLSSNFNVNRAPSTYQISFAIKYDF
jgi:hypothetical protein